MSNRIKIEVGDERKIKRLQSKLTLTKFMEIFSAGACIMFLFRQDLFGIVFTLLGFLFFMRQKKAIKEEMLNG